MEKSLLSVRRLSNFQLERDDQVRVSVRVWIIPILADVLGISETILCEQGSTCYGWEGSLCDLKTFIIWGTCPVSCVVWINCSDQVRDMSVVCNYVFTLFFPLQKHLFPLKCIAIAVFHINVIHSILKINDLPSWILTNNLRVRSFSLHSCCHHGEPQVLVTNFAHQNFRDSPQDAYCLMLFQ